MWTHMAKPEYDCQAWVANIHNEIASLVSDGYISKFLLDITTKIFFFFLNLKLNMLHIELNNSLPSQSCFFLSILYVIHWYQWPPATESKSPDQFLLCFSFFTLATPIPDTQPEAVRTFRIHRDDDGQIWSDKNSKQLCMTKDIINKRWITDQFKYCLWYWFHSYSSNCISIVIIGCHIFSFHR